MQIGKSFGANFHICNLKASWTSLDRNLSTLLFESESEIVFTFFFLSFCFKMSPHLHCCPSP